MKFLAQDQAAVAEAGFEIGSLALSLCSWPLYHMAQQVPTEQIRTADDKETLHLSPLPESTAYHRLTPIQGAGHRGLKVAGFANALSGK